MGYSPLILAIFMAQRYKEETYYQKVQEEKHMKSVIILIKLFPVQPERRKEANSFIIRDMLTGNSLRLQKYVWVHFCHVSFIALVRLPLCCQQPA